MKAIRDLQEESAIELLYSLGYGYLGDGRWAKQGNQPPAMPAIVKQGAEPSSVSTAMTDARSALDTPGAERLKEWAAIGPVQRAAVEVFADRLTAPRADYVLLGVPPFDDQALAQVVSEQGDPPEDGTALSRWALRLAQAAQAAVLNPRIEATEEATPPSTMAAEEAVVRAANSLIALAQWLGVSFTVTHNPRRPFAMGNYDHVVDAWPARTHRKPVLTHGEG